MRVEQTTVFSRFTASARRVMQQGFREARSCQHDFVGTEHLLYGILCDSSSPAAALLRSLNANIQLLIAKVELSLQRHGESAIMEQFPLSPATRRVFQAAGEEATRGNHHMIGPEHLLLGLLREPECEAAQLLLNHGIALPSLRDAIARIPPDAHPEAQLKAAERLPVAPGDNPTSKELEEWIAPPITHIQSADNPWDPVKRVATMQGIEAQLRLTQLLLGFGMGYVFGHIGFGWVGGVISGLIGLMMAATHNSWLGILYGLACGYFVGASGCLEVFGALDMVLYPFIGGFLGSFFGDAWRFRKRDPVQHSSIRHEPTHDLDENS